MKKNLSDADVQRSVLLLDYMRVLQGLGGSRSRLDNTFNEFEELVGIPSIAEVEDRNTAPGEVVVYKKGTKPLMKR